LVAYILQRLVQAIFVIIIVTMLIFLIMHLLPGDPILLILTQEQVAFTTTEQIETLRHEFGLDKSLPLQYLDWLGKAVRGDLGISIVDHTKVASSIARSAPITLHIGLLAFIISNIIGIPLGIISAARRGHWIDTGATVLANLGITIPGFWLAILLVYIFSLKLGWLPVFGYTSPFNNFVLSTKQIILPVICLSIMPIASAARQTRSSMLEVLRQDYVRTAWSKGNSEKTVILQHTLKNALIPVITLTGMGLSHILAGSVLIEQVFNIPGMGRLMVDAILSKDYAIVQGEILVIAAMVLLGNLLVDISYGWIDPRVRYR
jgi:peptide/nickel transport system permease protein